MMFAIRKVQWFAITLVGILQLGVASHAQAPKQEQATGASVPRLVNFSGKATDEQGKTVAGIAGVTFAVYRDEQDGMPLWTETQNVTADKSGHFTAQLGASNPNGLPLELFTTTEARWLGVRVNGGNEQRRVLLLSVPYALKAADAQTLNGLPASAFMLAVPMGIGSGSPATQSPAATSASYNVPASSNVTTTGGTVNALPLWTTGTNIQSSLLTQTGSTAVNIRGKLNLPATGLATAAKGFNSRPEALVASVFNKSIGTAVAQTFQLQAEPLNNNTGTASGTLNLLYGSGTVAPAETGFKINNKGLITFAPGQTFPGTGPGTVKSVGLSAPTGDFSVSGSPVTSSGTLSLQWLVSPTSSDIANAIVKRDSSGSFNAGAINTVTLQGTSVGGTNSALGPFAAPVIGINQATGATNGFGVFGDTNSGLGYGVSGAAEFGGIGVLGQSGFHNSGGQGVVGESFGAINSANGFGPDGVDGIAHAGLGSGVAALNTADGDGLFAASSTGFAGFFNGDVGVNGNLSKSGGSFKIDHPLDPANKYLYHSFVESPEMMNIYNGNITTDAQGKALVLLPEWFESLNRDFRYQLTVIGQFAQAIVSSELANHSFVIQTDKPSIKVSWQVTGIRQDAWANAHRIPVEQEKPSRERGHYLHPELFGAPAEKSVTAVHHPGFVKTMQEGKARQFDLSK